MNIMNTSRFARLVNGLFASYLCISQESCLLKSAMRQSPGRFQHLELEVLAVSICVKYPTNLSTASHSKAGLHALRHCNCAFGLYSLAENNMSLSSIRPLARSFATAAPSSSKAAYPFSKAAIIPQYTPPTDTDRLRKGKGLMEYVRKTLPPPNKQAMLETYFGKRSPQRILPGSVVALKLNHAPTTFAGVVISIRRRGPDTSMLIRNVMNRTGVETQFFVNSPHVRSIQVVQRASGGQGARDSKRSRRAKLFYLRDSPEKMTAISAGVRA